MPAGHMPNPANQACTVCHTAAPSELHDARRNAVLHTGITSSQCAQCHGGHDGAHLVQQLHAEGCGAHASAYSVLGRNRAAAPAIPRALMRSADLRADEHDSGHARLRRHHLHHLPREGPDLLHGRGESGAAGPAGRSHQRVKWWRRTIAASATPRPTGTRTDDACGPYAESRPTRPARVCHTARRATMRRWRRMRPCTPASPRGCITCHGAPNATAPVFYLNYTPKDAVLSPVHIPTSSTPCEDCHAISFTSLQRHDDELGQAHLDVRGDRQDLRRLPRPIDLEVLRRHQPDHAAERPPRRPGLQRLPQSRTTGTAAPRRRKPWRKWPTASSSKVATVVSAPNAAAAKPAAGRRRHRLRKPTAVPRCGAAACVRAASACPTPA